MYSIVRPFFLHAVTSVHAGSGSEIGLVDLPIQREKHTGFPKIESSSLKGALRYHIAQSLNEGEKKRFELVFGSEKGEENNTQSSAIALSDARVLLFPVKSMRGVFAWITCPYVLERFNNEVTLHQYDIELLPVPAPNTVSSNQLLVIEDKVVLEEYTFKATVSEDAQQLAERLTQMVAEDLQLSVNERLVVLTNDDFSDFVKLSTEVNARIKINSDTGTVDTGALWYEENVPPETIFYSFLYIGNVRGEGVEGLREAKEVEAFLLKENRFPKVFQLGGNSTLGRGMLRTIWL